MNPTASGSIASLPLPLDWALLSEPTLTELKAVLVAGVMLWLIGRAIHVVSGRASETKRIHGQFIPEWTGGVSIGAGLIALSVFGPAPDIPAPPSTTFAGTGLLLGLAAGWIHGNVRLRRFRLRNPNGERQQPNSAPEDGNPYRPP